MTKGNQGSSEFAAIFKAMLRDADEDTSLRKLVRQLLIKICGADFPRHQILYMLGGGNKGYGLLRFTNATFVRASLTNDRKLKTHASEGSSVIEASVLDR